MSGEAVLVPLVWESITGVADAVKATIAARKEAARQEAEAQRERIRAWQDFQFRQQQTQAQQRLSLEAVQRVQQELVDGGLQEVATRVYGGALAEGFVEQGVGVSDQRLSGLMTHIDRQLASLPTELFNDQRLPFARLRSQLRRLQQASAPTVDEVDDLASTLQRSFSDYVRRTGQEAEQQRQQAARAEQLLTRILQARALSVDEEDAAALHRLQQKLMELLAERRLSPAALDVISNRFDGLRERVECAVAEDEMNDYLSERVTHHLNAMGYATLSAFTDRQAGRRRDAEFALPDGDRLRIALQEDLKMGFQLTHETHTVLEKTLSGEALGFFRQQEERWCRDMKELIRRLIKDGVPYELQFERNTPEASIPVVVVENATEIDDEDDEDQHRHRRKKELYFT